MWRLQVQAAVALHQAVAEVRQRYPDNPTLWAAYVHIGR